MNNKSASKRVITTGVVIICAAGFGLWVERNGQAQSSISDDGQNGQKLISPQFPGQQKPFPEDERTDTKQAPSVPSTPPTATNGPQNQLLVLQDKQRSMPERIAAAKALRSRGDASALTTLVSVVTNASEHAVLRLAVTRALGGFNEAALVPLSATLVNATEDRNVRAASALALGEIGTDRAVDALAAAKRDEDALVRFKVIQGLERTHNAAAASHVTEMLTDSDRFARVRAIHAIGHLGTPATVPMLETILRDPQSDNFTRIACLTSLGQLGGVVATGILKEYETNGNELLRINAAKALQTQERQSK